MSPSTTTTARAKLILSLGTPVTTTTGGTVTVYGMQDPVVGAEPPAEHRTLVGVDIGECSSAALRTPLRIELYRFALALNDLTLQRATSPVARPALPDYALVEPGHCLRGWVTFDILSTGAPVTVRYDGSVHARWATSTGRDPHDRHANDGARFPLPGGVELAVAPLAGAGTSKAAGRYRRRNPTGAGQ